MEQTTVNNAVNPENKNAPSCLNASGHSFRILTTDVKLKERERVITFYCIYCLVLAKKVKQFDQ